MRQVLHSFVTVAAGSAQTAGGVAPIPPHAVKHGVAAPQMQSLTTKAMSLLCEVGLAVAQHCAHVVSVADGVAHSVQSVASAQGSPPVLVEAVPVVAVVFDPVVVVVIAPVVAPLPAPPLPVPPLLVVVSLPPQAAAATIDRTIALNAQDFMLMPPTTS